MIILGTYMYPNSRWIIICFDIVVQDLRKNNRDEENLSVNFVVLIDSEYTGKYSTTRCTEGETR